MDESGTNRPASRAASGESATAAKQLVAYVEPWSVRPGGEVELKVSSGVPGEITVELRRIVCADPTRHGPGVADRFVADLGSFTAQEQPVHPGSSVLIPTGDAFSALGSFTLRANVWPTLAGDGRPRAVAGTWSGGDGGGFALGIDSHGAPLARVGSLALTGPAPAVLPLRRWSALAMTYDAPAGRLLLAWRPLERTLEPRTEGEVDLRVADGRQPANARTAAGHPMRIGAWNGAGGRADAHFDGKIEDVRLAFAALPLDVVWADQPARFDVAWDFSVGIDSDIVHDVGAGGLRLDGRTQQCPARAVTGSKWSGTTQYWRDAPGEYAATHFHSDDLVDAGWTTDLVVDIPNDLPSGIYALSLEHASTGERDDVPFFVVGAGPDTSRPPVAYLIATASYLAYANHRQAIKGAPWFPARRRLRREQEYLRDHPELGLSTYEHHADGSGVMYSSRRRPVLNIRPGAEGWTFTSATLVSAFLEHLDEPFDVITDEDLDRDGFDAIRPYRVIITDPHPEYWSTRMHDALRRHLDGGGRLMYLGGNGFYWRVAFHADFPGVLEVRRAEDGTRGWAAEPGESYHSFTGEYGGLWRRLGRTPNTLTGVGFVAQGFDRATHYLFTPAAADDRVLFATEGLTAGPGDVFGDHGVGGGAAGQEIDCADFELGTPAHTLVIATSADHGGTGLLRTKEEFLAVEPPVAEGDDPRVHADVTFFETPAGGAVFSTGSISWAGALASNGYDNDVARLTANVLRRFADPKPFELPNRTTMP